MNGIYWSFKNDLGFMNEKIKYFDDAKNVK